MAENGKSARTALRPRLAVAVAAALALVLPAGALSQGGQQAQTPAGEGKGSKQKAAPAGPPKIAARAWILVDPRDGEVLASSAPNRELPIASATKLMTAYLALKKLNANREAEGAAVPGAPGRVAARAERRREDDRAATCSTG